MADVNDVTPGQRSDRVRQYVFAPGLVLDVDHGFEEPRIPAAPLARALSYRDAANMLRTLADDRKGTHSASTLGGDQRVWYVTKIGLYQLVGQRRLMDITDVTVREQVARFQDWIFGEVLPSIERTGTYVEPDSPAAAVSSLEREELVALRERYRALAISVGQAFRLGSGGGLPSRSVS